MSRFGFGGSFHFGGGGHHHHPRRSFHNDYHCAPVYYPQRHHHHHGYHHDNNISVGFNFGNDRHHHGHGHFGSIYRNHYHGNHHCTSTCHHGWGISRPAAARQVVNFQDEAESRDLIQEIKDIRKGKLDHLDIDDPISNNPEDKITIRRGENHGHLTLTNGNGKTVIIDKNVDDAVKELARLMVDLRKAAGSNMSNEQLSAMYVNGISRIAYSHTHNDKNDAVAFKNNLSSHQGDLLAQQKQEIADKAAADKEQAQADKQAQVKLAELQKAEETRKAAAEQKAAEEAQKLAAANEELTKSRKSIETQISSTNHYLLENPGDVSKEKLQIKKDGNNLVLTIGDASVKLSPVEEAKLMKLLPKYDLAYQHARETNPDAMVPAFNAFANELQGLMKDSKDPGLIAFTTAIQENLGASPNGQLLRHPNTLEWEAVPAKPNNEIKDNTISAANTNDNMKQAVAAAVVFANSLAGAGIALNNGVVGLATLAAPLLYNPSVQPDKTAVASK